MYFIFLKNSYSTLRHVKPTTNVHQVPNRQRGVRCVSYLEANITDTSFYAKRAIINHYIDDRMRNKFRRLSAICIKSDRWKILIGQPVEILVLRGYSYLIPTNDICPSDENRRIF